MMKRTAIILSLLLTLVCASYGQMQMGMRGAGKPIYYPFQLDSLFYWFDAMDAASLLDSVGGAVATDEGVATWADKSGNNWDVTQSTNGARPLYKATGGPGGNTPAVDFDGTNDFLSSTAHWWGSDDLTVFVVMKVGNATRNAFEAVITKHQRDNDAQFQMYWNNDPAATAEDYVFYFTAFRTGIFNTNNRSFITLGPTLQKSTTWKTYAFTKNALLVNSLYVNGSAISVTTVAAVGTGDGSIYDSAVPKLAIGARNVDGTPDIFLLGSISEIIVFSRALTADERVGVEQYLQQKWGL